MAHARPLPWLPTALILASGLATSAAPLKTVAWNGHPGAVSFTFDDACRSQVTNVLPALKSRGIHATFFVYNNTDFAANKDKWIQAARDGNELGNHTSTHVDLSLQNADSAKIHKEIVDQANLLRSFDPSIEAVTLAYPYCGTKDVTDRIANRENIISRTCSNSGSFLWGAQPPNWMRMTSLTLQDAAGVSSTRAAIDAAANSSHWLVTLNHGIGGDWMSIPTDSMNALFDRAIAKNLWVATYQNVAAYWRASKVLDTVTAKTSATGWTLSWTSPHPRMPRSVPVRVRLDKATFGDSARVFQKGVELARQTDGSYLVEFMNLGLEVRRPGSVGLAGQARPLAQSLRAERYSGSVRLAGLEQGRYGYSLWTLSGKRLARGTFSVEAAATPVTLVLAGRSEATLLQVGATDDADRQALLKLPPSLR